MTGVRHPWWLVVVSSWYRIRVHPGGAW